jgi:hypothetical protein
MSMHGSLFAPHNLVLCADLRPEPAIITTRRQVFHSTKSVSSLLGNECSCYFFNLLHAIVSWCMTCMSAVNIGNLSFLCLLIIWVYSLSQILNFYLLVDPVNILRNSFLIFDLDKQHPSLIGETTDRVTNLSFPFLECGCSHEDTLIPVSSSGFN